MRTDGQNGVARAAESALFSSHAVMLLKTACGYPTASVGVRRNERATSSPASTNFILHREHLAFACRISALRIREATAFRCLVEPEQARQHTACGVL
jgi:hypothetical protein